MQQLFRLCLIQHRRRSINTEEFLLFFKSSWCKIAIARQGIESILSPKQQRRPSLLCRNPSSMALHNQWYFVSRNIDDVGLLIGNQLNCTCNEQYVLNNLTAIGLQVKAVQNSEINDDICFNYNSHTSSICLKVLSGKAKDRNNHSSKRKQEGKARLKKRFF